MSEICAYLHAPCERQGERLQGLVRPVLKHGPKTFNMLTCVCVETRKRLGKVRLTTDRVLETGLEFGQI